jgi:aspartate aminotransferase
MKFQGLSWGRVQLLASSLTKHSSSVVRKTSHWTNIPLAPRDAILGLNEAFKADPSKTKVNLGVGAYRDDAGKPYILPSVAVAEKRVLERAEGHEYAGIAGVQEYIDLSLQFGYGIDSKPLLEKRIAAIQTLSGTGACRVFGEFASKFRESISTAGLNIYMPDPTWGNHIPIMRDSGLVPQKYRYFDPKTCGVDFRGMLEDVDKAPDGSLFMLHACAHNPTGCDPTV